MRIDKAHSPELQRSLREIKHRLETLSREINRVAAVPAKVMPQRYAISPGDVNIQRGDLTVDGQPPLYEITLDPDFADPARVMGTVYQNTETTMKIVQIEVKVTG